MISAIFWCLALTKIQVWEKGNDLSVIFCWKPAKFSIYQTTARDIFDLNKNEIFLVQWIVMISCSVTFVNCQNFTREKKFVDHGISKICVKFKKFTFDYKKFHRSSIDTVLLVNWFIEEQWIERSYTYWAGKSTMQSFLYLCGVMIVLRKRSTFAYNVIKSRFL